MAIEQEIWVRDIEEEIFDNNSFLDFAFNEDEYVIGGRVVHIPQSGGSGKVEKNRGEFPAKIRRRNDTDIVYVLDEYTSDPVKITNAEEKELSYDKRKSVIGEDTENLKQIVAEDFLYKWAANTSEGNVTIIETTGKEVPATAPGSTGERLSAILADLQKAQTELDAQGVLEADRYAMIPARLKAQLFPVNDLTIQTMMLSLTPEERKKGIIGEVCGFKILSRQKVLIYDGNGVLKAPGAASTPDDCEGILCWQKNAVGRAKGAVEFFEDLKNPVEYGDIYSMLARAGGRRRRKDNKGVVVIRQKRMIVH